MSLFDVPGWSMPTDIRPMAERTSRKRKRPVGENSSFKVQTAEVNIEKLMDKLDKEENNSGKNRKEKSRNQHDEETSGKTSKGDAVRVWDAGGRGPSRAVSSKITGKSNNPNKRTGNDANTQSSHSVALRGASSPSRPTHAHPESGGHVKTKKKKRRDSGPSADDIPEKSLKSAREEGSDAPLTNMQSRMKQSLEGARFRLINETLYKSDSKEARRLMHVEPQVFEEYHAGFRHQVTSWPSNPVNHFIRSLSSYTKRSVIVDLGCGDAALARSLVPKGYTVLSFDLVSANSFIVAADICEEVPIPGSEVGDEGQIVDVVVCSLSLMSTNWLNCIREARRILKKGGELKIAEVASRFTSVDKFTSLVCSIGFRLLSKDESNTHFILLDFKKTEGSESLDDKVWKKVLSHGDVLQPCEYKRR